MGFTQIFEHRFPTDDWPLAVLSERVDRLAERLGLAPQDWEVDGLGPARGFCIRTESGLVVLVYELAHAMKSGLPGPAVSVDASDIARAGIAPLLTEVLDALNLAATAVTWRTPDTTRQHAADFVARVPDIMNIVRSGRSGAPSEGSG
jgi:hypothetical protein